MRSRCGEMPTTPTIPETPPPSAEKSAEQDRVERAEKHQEDRCVQPEPEEDHRQLRGDGNGPQQVDGQAKRRGRGRPKGTFSPSRWTPERIADLFWDAESALRSLEAEGIIKRPNLLDRPAETTVGIVASKEERVNKRLVAGRLKRDFSQKYRDTTTEQLRQMLSKAYERTQNERVLEDFQAAVLANMLGETKNRE
jgi:hypothetical protein